MIITLILSITALVLAVIVIRKTKRFADAALSAHIWLNSAPIDYSNGVEHNGLDEGFVNGWKGHHEIVEDLARALSIDDANDDEYQNELPF